MKPVNMAAENGTPNAICWICDLADVCNPCDWSDWADGCTFRDLWD